MGIQYLCIDALCIVQDDHKDWELESSKMGTIYANSYLTIAASSTSDGSFGFLTERTRPDFVRLDYSFDDNLSSRLLLFPNPQSRVSSSSDHFLDDEPLSRPAWTLQERYLSNCVLHYGRHQMFFE